MADVKKLIIREHTRTVPKVNPPETRFWKKFKFSVAFKEYGGVSHLSFSGSDLYTATTGTKVTVYSARKGDVAQTVSRFKKTAYSGFVRRDGKLLVAGSEDNSVQVFEVGTRSILRQFAGHARAVHVTRFDESDIHVLTGSDDKTVRCWDLSTAAEVLCMRGHEDYVRCASTSPSQPDSWLTGSYDHTVKLWDKRSGEVAATLDHGAPVEGCLLLPSGSMAISCGGNRIKVWDVHRSGGGPLAVLSNHQKTVSCISLDGTGTRLLSGSLDHQVKMYDLSTYKVTHSIKYAAPVLSVGTTSSNSHLVVGCSDGVLNVRESPVGKEDAVKRPISAIKPGSFAYFARGKNIAPGPRDSIADSGVKRQKLSKYDQHLKKFQYTEALDSVLETRQNAEVVVSVLQELFRRDAMKSVLSGRNEETLAPVLSFIVRNVTDPKHCTVLVDVAHILADLYSSVIGMSPAIDKLFERLRRRLQWEIKAQEQYMKLQGAMECIFTASGLE